MFDAEQCRVFCVVLEELPDVLEEPTASNARVEMT
jgi:hypothetical protein